MVRAATSSSLGRLRRHGAGGFVVGVGGLLLMVLPKLTGAKHTASAARSLLRERSKLTSQGVPRAPASCTPPLPLVPPIALAPAASRICVRLGPVLAAGGAQHS